jgi:hypothetical protein
MIGFQDDALRARAQLPDWRSFVKARHAVFTVANSDTGNRFTFKVTKHEDRDLWFVSVLRGPDNESDYTYVGAIFGHTFRLTRGSRVGEDARSFRVFRWLHDCLESRVDLPAAVHVYHEGCCGRCGRRLTVPESIRQGFGPECIRHIQ